MLEHGRAADMIRPREEVRPGEVYSSAILSLPLQCNGSKVQCVVEAQNLSAVHLYSACM